MQKFEFDEVVVITLGGERIAVHNGKAALSLLETRWAPDCGPSHERAVTACRSFLDGTAPMLAARATFCVAAMEAGLKFELFPDPISLLEVEIALVAEDGVRNDE